jgi:hypothetical protein
MYAAFGEGYEAQTTAAMPFGRTFASLRRVPRLFAGSWRHGNLKATAILAANVTPELPLAAQPQAGNEAPGRHHSG